MVKERNWILITPNLPPDKSGVAFFSKNIAEHLLTIGQKVHVHSIEGTPSDATDYQFQTSFGHNIYDSLSSIFCDSKPTRVFFQYNPKKITFDQISELKALKEKFPQIKLWSFYHDLDHTNINQNLFARWWKALSQNRNTVQLGDISNKVFIPTDKWKRYFKRVKSKLEVLPVPSNVPFIPDEIRAMNQRKAFAGKSKHVLCCFGSFNDEDYNSYLEKLIPKVVADLPSCKWLMIGRFSEDFREMMIKQHSEIGEKIQSAGELDAGAISAHLQAVDIIVQPYPDGVSTRRSSAMAALAHGKPMIASTGVSTESFWTHEGIIKPLDVSSTKNGAKQILELVKDQSTRKALEERSRRKYETSFSIDHFIQAITKN